MHPAGSFVRRPARQTKWHHTHGDGIVRQPECAPSVGHAGSSKLRRLVKRGQPRATRTSRRQRQQALPRRRRLLAPLGRRFQHHWQIRVMAPQRISRPLGFG